MDGGEKNGGKYLNVYEKWERSEEIYFQSHVDLAQVFKTEIKFVTIKKTNMICHILSQFKIIVIT